MTTRVSVCKEAKPAPQSVYATQRPANIKSEFHAIAKEPAQCQKTKKGANARKMELAAPIFASANATNNRLSTCKLSKVKSQMQVSVSSLWTI